MSPGSTPHEVPFLVSAPSGLRFEPLLAEDRTGSPFLTLSDSGRFTDVLLGRIALGDRTVRLLAVKLQKSAYRSGAPGGLPAIANPQVDELWSRKRATLLAQDGSTGTAGIFDLGDESARQRPVTFCTTTRKYFHAFCPETLELLEDCRDDSLLRDCGLEPYSESDVRYLYPPPSASEDSAGPRTFYTISLLEERNIREDVRVRRRAELYDDWADLLREGVPEDKRTRLEAIFPCATCERSEECYPEDSGEGKYRERLVPLSYHEFHVLPCELMQLHIDEFGDLVGGADWNVLKRQALETTGSAGRERALGEVEAALRSSPRWLHLGEDLLPLEVLRLKLAAFSQLCRGLRAHYARSGKPHLGLHPGSVMVSLPQSSPDLPALWSFQVKLVDSTGWTTLRGVERENGPKDFPVPLLDGPLPYVSPSMWESSPGKEEPLNVTIDARDGNEKETVLHGKAISGRTRFRGYQPKDAVRLVPAAQPGGLDVPCLWGVIDGIEANSFRFSASGSGVLEGLEPPLSFGANGALFRRPHLPCDIYSLGMILFRLLLVNDERDLFAVDDGLKKVLDRLSLSFPEGGPRHEREKLESRVHIEIEAAGDLFDRTHLLHSRSLRERGAVAIPQRIWVDLITFGIRLTSFISGFSYCAHHGDYPGEHPETVLDEILVDLDALSRRVHVELFDRSRRDREVSLACRRLMAEISEQMLEGGRGETPAEGAGEAPKATGTGHG